jgi:type II secretory pathway pseudopilin PulG
MHRLNRIRLRTGGFTLVELAVVVLVITLLLGGLLVPLATQVEQRNVSETQKRLQEVKEALIGYAMANGRFPCPAVSDTAGDIGVEATIGNPNIGLCKAFFNGYVPGRTLGLSNLDSQGYVVDAWGLQQNRIRYAISDTTIGPTAHVFTAQWGMRNAGMQAIGAPLLGDLLFVCASSPGTGVVPNCGVAPTLVSDAIFIVYSLGKNAATSGAATSPNISADEAANLNIDPVFVSRANSNRESGEFDDILLWPSRYNIISQLTVAGQLP